MRNDQFAQDLKARIEDAYAKRDDQLGWRLLYSPPHVLDGASVAFIGMNPGGDHVPTNHGEFAMDRASAYTSEAWGSEPGQAKLQKQAQALFRRLNVSPEDVLAGNLVPFRSPSWDKMKDRKNALTFGKSLWNDIFDRARPTLVIAMGRETINAVADLLNVRETERIPVGWGNINGHRGCHRDIKLVGLPHLSRFAIVGRRESEPGLQRLLRH